VNTGFDPITWIVHFGSLETVDNKAKRPRVAIPGLLLCLSLVSKVASGSGLTTAEEREVLPSVVVPTHYDLTIASNADTLVFKGAVRIAVNVAAPTREIVLNAKDLSLDRATLDGVSTQAIALDAKLGRATLVFANPVAAGAHQLAIEYHGSILKSTFGFFAMDYDTPAGKRRTLATNFEPAGARMLLPCWDEPARKATFTVTIDAPKDRMAISNMPIEKVTPLGRDLHRVRFAETPKMSTYLLFLSVGDYERVHRKVDGTDVGIVVKRGDLGRAAYALQEALALLHYYNDYFGFRFPLPKLDLIAAPGQITGDSMENWGAIFYSADQLNLVNDAWALGQAGYASAADLLDYLSALPATADPIIWSRVCALLVAIDDDHAQSPKQEEFRRFALSTLRPVVANIGAPGPGGEDPAVTSLRTDIWRAQARFGEAGALARGKEIYRSEKGSQAELRTALEIVARDADEPTFDALLAKARATADPLGRTRILQALAGVADPRLASRFTEVALSTDAASGTAPNLLFDAAQNNPDVAWAALAPHLDDPNLPIDEPIRGLVISAIAAQSRRPSRIDDIQGYANRHLPADARQAAEAAVASIRLNQRVREQAIPQIDAWIAAHPFE
jgi:aminopeptidase N